jgi:hypothetical protein
MRTGLFRHAFNSTTDTIAIACTNGTTHSILDVAGFYVADTGQVNPANLGPAMRMGSRAQRVSQAHARPLMP